MTDDNTIQTDAQAPVAPVAPEAPAPAPLPSNVTPITENPAVPEVTGGAPVRTFTTKSTEGVEQVHLFSIDGVDYFIPKKTRVNLGLKYLYQVKTEGESRAGANLLMDLLGDENYVALMNYEDLEEKDLMDIMDVAAKVVLGEGTLGTSGN